MFLTWFFLSRWSRGPLFIFACFTFIKKFSRISYLKKYCISRFIIQGVDQRKIMEESMKKHEAFQFLVKRRVANTERKISRKETMKVPDPCRITVGISIENLQLSGKLNLKNEKEFFLMKNVQIKILAMWKIFSIFPLWIEQVPSSKYDFIFFLVDFPKVILRGAILWAQIAIIS